MKRFIGVTLLLLFTLSAAFAMNSIRTYDEMDVLVITPPDLDVKTLADRINADNFEYKNGYLKYLPEDLFNKCQKIEKRDYVADAEQLLLKLNPKVEYKYRNTVEDGQVMMYSNGTKKCITNKHVNFDMYYNGIRLFGPGAKMRVYFGENGVEGVIAQLWGIKAIGKVKVKSEKDVINTLERDGVKVISIELVYFVPLPEDGETYIYPAYVVKCIQNVDGERVEMGRIIPAVSMDELKSVISKYKSAGE